MKTTPPTFRCDLEALNPGLEGNRPCEANKTTTEDKDM
jgi:hypothetical protein